jgi:hypothetical protein
VGISQWFCAAAIEDVQLTKCPFQEAGNDYHPKVPVSWFKFRESVAKNDLVYKEATVCGS